MSMTPKERAELVRVVKARFRLMKMQARLRAAQIVAAEKRAEEAARLSDLRRFRGRAETLRRKMEPLEEAKRQLVEDAKAAGFDVSDYAGLSFSVRSRFEYRADETIERQVLVELERLELEAVERLLVDELGSPEAREALAAIPTIDDLVAGKARLVVIEGSAA